MTWKIMAVLILAFMFFLATMFMGCSSEEVTVIADPDVPAYIERLRTAEERIHNLEIQVQLLAEGEREKAALLHGFETIR